MPSPEQLITDLPLIRRYAQRNEVDDLRFREHLKTGINLSNTELDTVVWKITDDVWSRIDCLSCGNCCKTLQIVVDDRDIKRLSRRLEMSPREFEQQYVGVDPADRTKFFRSTPCQFLAPDNRCTVYEDRPRACRDFPYLKESGFRNRMIAAIENSGTCPIVFNALQALKQRFRRKKPS